MNYTTICDIRNQYFMAPFTYDQEAVDTLEATLSTERLSSYLRQAKGEKQLALELYLWNVSLSESLYGPLQILEVTMRNSINRELRSKFGDEWYKNQRPVLFQERQHDRIASAVNGFDKSRPITLSDIVASVSFGFWTDILYFKVYDNLWNGCLHRAFPHRAKGTRRSSIGPAVDNLRTLRNRIAHHEPIWNHPLDRQHQRIIEIISWSCPVAAKWTESHSRFDETWKQKPEF